MESDTTNENRYVGEHTISFTETRWNERLWRFLPYLPREIPLFATVTISFWGIAEVLAEIGGERLGLKDLAIPALATSLVVAAYKAIQKYRAYVPEALLAESKAIRAIFRKGASGWQFSLARQMLLERTGAFDRTLDRIENGAHYIAPRTLELSQYMNWLQDRPKILRRLVRSVAVQCTLELPSVLAVTKDEKNLLDLKDSVYQLSSLYQAATDFELECRSIEPPEQLSDIHQMMYGWSAPIRSGVREFMSILEILEKIDPKAIKAGSVELPNLNIKFMPPENIDAFVERLASLDIGALLGVEGQ